MARASLSLATVLIGVSFACPVLAQSEDDKLGKVHFETSCNAEAQKLFDRGMLYQHSFWYRASQKMFEDTLKADPGAASPIGVSPLACCGIRISRRRRRISRRVRQRSRKRERSASRQSARKAMSMRWR